MANNSPFAFRQLNLSDSEEIANMYKTVEINKTNYLEKMSDGENSFKNTGGMFLINDIKKIEELILSKEDILIGAQKDDKICGMIWYNTFDNNYPFDDISYLDGKENYKSILSEAVNKNNLFVGKEIIVLPNIHNKLAYRLFRKLFEEALANGKTYKTGEVYHVDAYEDENGYHECDLINNPSYHTLLNTGGVHIGFAPQKVIKKESIKYYITPWVFFWDLKESIKTVDEKIDKK